MDVVNVNICLARAPAILQVYPGGIIGCHEARGMFLDVSRRSPGVSSRIQEMSLDANIMVCL